MKSYTHNFRKRISSIRLRIKSITSLRKLVSLPNEYDISERQWSVLESQLSLTETKLLTELNKNVRVLLPYLDQKESRRKLNSKLGSIEIKMTKTFTFFDTYMDVLTQRNSPELGPLLAGCDYLAWDSLHKDQPALEIIEPPLVYCDRGFGASILREGVSLPDLTPNPLPLIQIPYSRLKEKYNLTSIIHEAGHEVMVRLGLVSILPKVIRKGLQSAKAPNNIKDLFALWIFEIGPDFWTFCASGIAQTAGIKDILSLPFRDVFRLSESDPHPPPYLRVLLSFNWCREIWGKGIWDEWERDWLSLYPLNNLHDEDQDIFKNARRFLPVVTRTLLTTKFKVLNGRTIPDLFTLSTLAPSELIRIASTAGDSKLNLKGVTPSVQLAAFRLIREEGKLKEAEIDQIMTKWLLSLSKRRKNFSIN